MNTTNSDPRSQLGSSGAPRAAGANVAPQYFEFGHMDPTVVTPSGGRQWWVRSQALVIGYLELAAEDPVTLGDHPDEYMVIVPEGSAPISISAGADHTNAVAGQLVAVPSGNSTISSADASVVVGVFSSQSADLCARSANADFYESPDPNVAAWTPWPAATGGPALRVYDAGTVPPDPDRFGRIYRCSSVMVNWLYPSLGPREPDKLSPHHHDDFEQISLQLGGSFVHHIRTPWTSDMADWRDDEHHHTSSPSVTVIPPPSIHTSQAVGGSLHQLIDIFAPPRFDFSARPGWILNADDYPMPEDTA